MYICEFIFVDVESQFCLLLYIIRVLTTCLVAMEQLITIQNVITYFIYSLYFTCYFDCILYKNISAIEMRKGEI